MLDIGWPSIIVRHMALFCLFDLVVMRLSMSFDLVIQNVIGPAALFALSLLGFDGFQLHCKLLQLVLSVKQALSFENSLLHCQVEHKEESVDLNGLWIWKHLLFEHVNLVNQLVYHLATLLADAFVVLEHILRTYVKRAQVIKKELLEFLPSVIVIYPHRVLSVSGITRGVLKIALCQHHLVFCALVGHRPCLIYVLTCSDELLQFQIRLTLVCWDFWHIQLCLILTSINIAEVGCHDPDVRNFESR